MNLQTASSSYSSNAITGGASVSCPRTFVFFRLMVSAPKCPCRPELSGPSTTGVPPGRGSYTKYNLLLNVSLVGGSNHESKLQPSLYNNSMLPKYQL